MSCICCGCISHSRALLALVSSKIVLHALRIPYNLAIFCLCTYCHFSWMIGMRYVWETILATIWTKWGEQNCVCDNRLHFFLLSHVSLIEVWSHRVCLVHTLAHILFGYYTWFDPSRSAHPAALLLDRMNIRFICCTAITK